LIKANKDEDEKVRLEKEKAQLAKHLQKLQPSPHLASSVASYQSRLEKVNEELAHNAKRMRNNLTRSAQAEENFNAFLSQPKINPELDQLPTRVKSLESELSELEKLYNTSGVNDPGEQLQKALRDLETFRQTTQSSEQDLNEFRGKLKGIENSLEGCIQGSVVLDQSMAHMHSIANSVDPQANSDGTWQSRLTQLEANMDAVGKAVEEKLPIFEKMVQDLDDNTKVANEERDQKYAAIRDQQQVSDEQFRKRFAKIEDNLNILKSNREGLVNQRTTVVAHIGTDLDAQKQQLDKQIAAGESRLNALLRAQEQKSTNGALVLAQAQPSTTEGDLGSRFTALEERIKRHDVLLATMNEIQSKAYSPHSDELNDLAHKIKDLPSKKDCTDIQIKIHEDLQQHLDGVKRRLASVQLSPETVPTLEKQISDNATALRALLNTVTPILQVPETISKLEGRYDGHSNAIRSLENNFQPLLTMQQAVTNTNRGLETHANAIRSLEERMNNTLSEDLVHRMSLAMHELYPNIGQLTQQWKEYRSLMDTKFSTLEATNRISKAEVYKHLADLEKNAQETAERSHSEESNSQGSQLSPEQLKALGDLTALLEKVTTLESQCDHMKESVLEHGDELKQRLQEMSEMKNSLTVQSNTFTELSEKVDGLQGNLEGITETTSKIDLLSQNVDDLAEAAKGRVITYENHVLDQLQSRVKGLEDSKDEALQRETDNLKALDSGFIRLKTGMNEHLDSLRSRLDTLESSNETAQQDIINNDVIDELRCRLKELEDLNETGGQLNATLRGDLDSKSDSPPEKSEFEEAMNEKMRGYLNRLRKVEDQVKAMEDQITALENSVTTTVNSFAINAKTFSAADQSPASNQQLDQRIEKPGVSHPVQNSRSITASKALKQPTPPPRSSGLKWTPTQTPFISSNSKKESRTESWRKSQAPKAASTSGLVGDVAKPRRIENLKGKRRRESDGNESEISTTDSSARPASPTVRSPATSVLGDPITSASKKERKLARKKEKEAAAAAEKLADKAARKASKKQKTN
jgi:hypothetical protein